MPTLFCEDFSSPQISKVREKALSEMTTIKKIANANYCLSELAFSFPSDINGYQYNLELGKTRNNVGSLFGDTISDCKEVFNYNITLLSSGTCLELFETGSDLKQNILIYWNGKLIGKIRVLQIKSILGLKHPVKWEVLGVNKSIGLITREAIINNNGLMLDSNNGIKLPVRLNKRDSWRDDLVLVTRILLFTWLFSPPPENHDYVIPEESTCKLTDELVQLYFAINVAFRTIYFQSYNSGSE